MYTVGNIIYGVPLSRQVLQEAKNHINEGFDLSSVETLGFKPLYHDNWSYQTGFCGVVLAQIDECSNVNLSKFLEKWKPNDKQRHEVDAAVAALPEWIKQIVGTPNVWIMWSTS